MQPSEFEEMDFDEGIEIARRVTEMYVQDRKLEEEIRTEHTKALIKALGARG